MDQKIRCQSCGMPLGEFTDKDGKTSDNFGTNADSSKNQEFCGMCFQKGEFTQPDLTLEGMIQMSVEYMISTMNIPQEKAETMVSSVIPYLKRWQE